MTLGRSPVRLSLRVDWRMPLRSRATRPVRGTELTSIWEILDACRERIEV